jgi:hypothetical protein
MGTSLELSRNAGAGEGKIVAQAEGVDSRPSAPPLPAPLFLQVLIPKDFKCRIFASVDSEGDRGLERASVDSAGVKNE